MFRTFFSCQLAVVFAAVALTAPLSATEHPSVQHPVNLAPSADLVYVIKAKQSGLNLTLNGDARISWTASANQFDIVVETKAKLLGKILDSHSEGVVDRFGLAPVHLTEKRFRKPTHTVNFDRTAKTISFSESSVTYPIKGGEQDRTSITWQLVSIARGAPAKVKPGTEWPFLVVGRRDAEAWTFKVIGRETIRTPLGEVSAIHISKLPSESREQQHLDLWLAPSLDWYPVRMLFTESNGTEVDQLIQKILKK
jgi:hypothetical protein